MRFDCLTFEVAVLVPLDQPEQFLVELSQMSHFPERMECMMLRKRFNETLFNIGELCPEFL